MKTGMTANYVATSSDHIVRVDSRANNVWVEIDGIRIQIMRDGTDDEPEVCIDVWPSRRLDEGEGNPLATVFVDTTAMRPRVKVW